MKIAVLYPSYRTPGGAEEYLAHLVRALKELNHEVTIYLVGGTRGSRSTLDAPIQVIKTFETSSIYDILLKSWYASKLLGFLRERHDVVINAKASELLCTADICIVHFPVAEALYHGLRSAGIDPKYYESSLWSGYIKLFKILAYKRRGHVKNCRIIVTNSTFTSAYLKTLAGVDRSIVIPPPLDAENAFVGCLRRKWRKEPGLIVTISRYDPSKNLEKVIYVAKHLPEARFVIAGRALDGASIKYFHGLRVLIDKYLAKNVALFLNVSSDFKYDLLAKAHVYFHPTIGEHYGMSVAEALCFGAIPIVPRRSGACLDIVYRYNVGECYDTYDEAIEIIKSVLSENPEPTYMDRVSKLLREVSYESFKHAVNKVLQTASRDE